MVFPAEWAGSETFGFSRFNHPTLLYGRVFFNWFKSKFDDYRGNATGGKKTYLLNDTLKNLTDRAHTHQLALLLMIPRLWKRHILNNTIDLHIMMAG